MKPSHRKRLVVAALAGICLALGTTGHADLFDTNDTTLGFGVTNGSTYDWWTANTWSDTSTVDDGTAAVVTWQGLSGNNQQAFFVGSGIAGENYTVRLGGTGSTDTYVQNIAINVTASGGGSLSGAAGNVTIGNSGDTGKLILSAPNSVGAQNNGTLTINNGINLNAKTFNFRGGNVIVNGVVSGTGASKVAFGSGTFGLTSGTLTLANTANTYAGRANTDYINANYTLAVTKLADGGSNSSIGTSSANIGINGGTLKYIGDTGAQSTNLGLHVGSAGAFVSADGVTSSDTISITGAPTYSAANSARTITLTGANTGDNTMGFVFNDNGTGVNILTKTGAGKWIVTQSNGYTGQTTASGGTLVAANTAAFGPVGRVINFNTGTVELATDTTANAYVFNLGSGNTGTVVVNRATSDSTMTHTMGTATLGNGTLNIEKGSNVTDDATLEFAGINLTAGITGLATGTMLNPTTARVLVSGNITRTGTNANLLTLDGTNTGNLISGVISGSQALIKSNTGTWELSNANTFNGTSKVTGGTLKLTNNLALQSSAFDTSGAGTLDISTLNTPTLGGLIGDTVTGQDLVLHAGVTSLTLNVGAGVTRTYEKNISGGAAGMTLTKTGSGTQVLGGTNSYSGLTTVGTAGELQITSAGAIGGTDVTVQSGGQLTLNGGITVTGKALTTSGSGRPSGTGSFIGGLQSVSGTNEWAGSVLLGANLSRLGARKDATLVVSGAIDDGVETYNLIVRNESFANGNNGAGNANTITVLSGASTYGGNTQLISGITKLDGGGNRLPVGTVLQFGLGNTNSKFDMNGRNQEFAGLAVTSTGTDTNRDWNANELTNSSGTLSTLTVNTTADQSFGGTLTNNVGIITGNIALVKDGAAKLTLDAANTYTGDTTITGGTLSLGAAGSIAGSSSMEIAAGAKLETALQTNYAIPAGQPITFGVDATGGGSSGEIVADGLDISAATVLFDVTGTLDDAAYVLATYTIGNLSGGAFASATPPAGYQIDYAHNGGTQIALVPLPSSDYGIWALANAGGQAANLDFDNDGVENGIEFFLGETGSGMTASPTSFTGTTATWTNGGNIAADQYGIQFVIQTSTNLENWTTILADNPNLSNLAGSVSFTLTGSGSQFVRLAVTPN
jgi:autotransporter-associated beta strand protein